MIKSTLGFLLVLLCCSTHSVAQRRWKVGAYDSFEAFQSQAPTDSFEFRVKSMKDRFIPELCRVVPVNSSLPQSHVQHAIHLIFDGHSLFLNLFPLRISKGFVEFKRPRTINFFLGRPQFDEIYEASQGLLGATQLARGGTEWDTEKSVPYIHDLRTNKIQPFIAPTMQRFLEPFPELALAYEKDPRWKDLETMKLYLDILNDLLEVEQQ